MKIDPEVLCPENLLSSMFRTRNKTYISLDAVLVSVFVTIRTC